MCNVSVYIYIHFILLFCKFSKSIYVYDIIFNVFFVGMVKLNDPVIDAKHRSHLVDGQLPPALRLQTHDECWSLDGSLQVAS